MRGIAGLDLEADDLSVQLHVRDGVEQADEVLHVLGLLGDLEGVVAVQVEAVGALTRDVESALDVLLGNEEEEDVVEQLVDRDGDVFALIVAVEALDLAGLLALVARPDGAEEGGLVLDEAAQVQALRGALGLDLGLARLSQRGELGVVDALLLDEELGKLHDAVSGGDLVGVDVGIENGNLDVVILPRLQIGEDLIGLGLGLLAEGEPVGDSLAVLGDDQIGHVVARGGGAHGVLDDVGLRGGGVIIALGGERRDLRVDLPHGVEARIGLDNDVVLLGERDVVRHAGQGEGAGDVQIGAAVGVGHAVVSSGNSGLRLNGEDEVSVHHFVGHAGDLERAAAGIGQILERDGLHLVRVHDRLIEQRDDLARVGVGLVSRQRPGDLVGGVIRADLRLGQREREYNGLGGVHRDERGLFRVECGCRSLDLRVRSIHADAHEHREQQNDGQKPARLVGLMHKTYPFHE